MASASIDPASKSRPYWLLIALACLVPAFLDAFRSYMTSLLAGDGVDWRGVVFAGSEWLFLGALTPITYVLSRRYPLKRETATASSQAAKPSALCVPANFSDGLMKERLFQTGRCVERINLDESLGWTLYFCGLAKKVR